MAVAQSEMKQNVVTFCHHLYRCWFLYCTSSDKVSTLGVHLVPDRDLVARAEEVSGDDSLAHVAQAKEAKLKGSMGSPSAASAIFSAPWGQGLSQAG